MNWGGVAKASISVFRLVSTIQKIGKKITAAIAQARAPMSRLCRRRDCFSVSISVPSLLVGQVLADHADQHNGGDIGDYHRDQAACRSHADIELQQRLVV